MAGCVSGACCADPIYQTLHIHLNKGHAMELLLLLMLKEQMGRCLHGGLDVLWGLTRLNKWKAKPTCADVAKEDMFVYPKA